MADVLSVLLDDLAAESHALFEVLQGLDDASWALVTPSAPWTIADQVSHLAWNDDSTVRALVDPVGFLRNKPSTTEALQAMVDKVVVDHHDRTPTDLLLWFRSARASLLDSFRGRDARARMPWYGPDMSLTSKLTARFMETWAHGLDIRDTIGADRDHTDRVRHVVFLGLQAIPNSFIAHGRAIPTEAVRLVVKAPSGEVWEMGAADAHNVVTGSASDLALVVTQRVNVADTNLVADGDAAREWLQIAQAFAGPPGSGRRGRRAAK
jgi:uncharacterized protein (TIGR03084 family)